MSGQAIQDVSSGVSSELWCEVIEALPQPLAVVDAAGRFLGGNEAARRLLGVLSWADAQLNIQGRDTFTDARFKRNALGVQEFFMAEVALTGGARAHVSVSLAPLSSGGWRAMFYDDEMDRAAVGRLFASIGWVLTQLPEPAALCDARRVICARNAPMEPLGLEVGQDLLAGFDAAGQVQLREAASQLMSGGQSGPLRLSTHSGVLTVRLVALAEPGSPSPHGFLVLATTEGAAIEAEEKLARAEHLLQLGHLATGVAHELKNPLTSILNYAQYLLRKYQDNLMDRRDHERLERIVADVERIDRFVHELMEIARPSEQAYGAVALHRVVAESVGLCTEALGQRGAAVVRELWPTELYVRGSEGELGQVVTNLLQNAVAALGDEGGQVRFKTREADGWVELEVEDNGHGMSAQVQERLFEPFFTTRRGKGGTGLGMVLVRTLVERHRGEITVWSEEGVGTRFVLRLPAMERAS
jgi:signal transduction histidine kinase